MPSYTRVYDHTEHCHDNRYYSISVWEPDLIDKIVLEKRKKILQRAKDRVQMSPSGEVMYTPSMGYTAMQELVAKIKEAASRAKPLSKTKQKLKYVVHKEV